MRAMVAVVPNVGIKRGLAAGVGDGVAGGS